MVVVRYLEVTAHVQNSLSPYLGLVSGTNVLAKSNVVNELQDPRRLLVLNIIVGDGNCYVVITWGSLV